jgi:hypothetical protein
MPGTADDVRGKPLDLGPCPAPPRAWDPLKTANALRQIELEVIREDRCDDILLSCSRHDMWNVRDSSGQCFHIVTLEGSTGPLLEWTSRGQDRMHDTSDDIWIPAGEDLARCRQERGNR